MDVSELYALYTRANEEFGIGVDDYSEMEQQDSC